MMWWAIWCGIVVAGGVGAAAAPAPESLTPIDLVQMDASVNDDENVGYAVAPMGGRYTGAAPWLYLLADMPRDSQVARSEEVRARRSFSVNPAVELLQRGAYNNYLEKVALNNREYLDRVGKRGGWRQN